MQLKKVGLDFKYTTKLSYANKYVLPKYNNVLGLEPKRQKKFNNNVFLPEYIKKIKQKLQII